MVLSKFSSASSFNMQIARLYEQAIGHATLADRILLGSFSEFLVLAAVCAVNTFQLPADD
jgi:hypothetical protein